MSKVNSLEDEATRKETKIRALEKDNSEQSNRMLLCEKAIRKRLKSMNIPLRMKLKS